ncbi:unnamed protein product, partial [Iphiclides podalirius]
MTYHCYGLSLEFNSADGLDRFVYQDQRQLVLIGELDLIQLITYAKLKCQFGVIVSIKKMNLVERFVLGLKKEEKMHAK